MLQMLSRWVGDDGIFLMLYEFSWKNIIRR